MSNVKDIVASVLDTCTCSWTSIHYYTFIAIFYGFYDFRVPVTKILKICIGVGKVLMHNFGRV